MLSIGVIWNPVSDYFNEIINEIKVRTNLLFYSVEAVTDHKSFIYDIYRDMLSIDKSKIDLKLSNLFLPNSNDIVVLIFEFDSKKVSYHPYKKKMVFTELDELKQSIRQKYSTKINNYIFDNVFHCTDDMDEYTYTLSVMRRYFDNIPYIVS